MGDLESRMWIDGLNIADLFSHKKTAVEFDRAKPVSLFLGANGSGKCLPSGSPVALWSGATKPIEHIRETDMLVGLDPETWTFRPEHPLRMMTSGVQPVFEVETESGHAFQCTGNHRLLTVNGWVELHKLSLGESVALPLRLPAGGIDGASIDSREAMFIGLLLGDGCLSGRGTSFTNADPLVLSKFRECAGSVLPGTGLRDKARTNPKTRIVTTTIHLSEPIMKGRRHRNHRVWADGRGLTFRTAHTKRVPPIMFGAGEPAISALLAGLMSTDGWVSPLGEAEYYTMSRGLAQDVRALFLRLGIVCTLRGRSVKDAVVYSVRPVAFGRRRFFDLVLPLMARTRGKAEYETRNRRPFHKGKTFALPSEVVLMLADAGIGRHELSAWRYGKGRRLSQGKFRDVLARMGVGAFGALARFASPDVGWDPIRSIRLLGDQQTFDLQMPSEAFVTWDTIVHNSSTSRAVEIALTGEVLALRGTGATVAQMIRTGASAGSVSLTAHSALNAKPVEIRRRVTAKGITTSVNGSPSTKGAYDLFARIKGDADPAAVFRVLTNVTGFFELAPDPQETARRQKVLLTGLVDQSVPADTFGAWPLSFGAVPTTFEGIVEAYGLVSARLTEVNRELNRITVDREALAGEPVTDALIGQIQAQIAEVRGQKEQRIAAQGDAAGRRALLSEALAQHRAMLAQQRDRLATRGPRPEASMIEDRQAHAQRIVDVEREHDERGRRQSEASGRRQTLSAGRQRLAERLEAHQAQQRAQPSLEAAQAALVEAREHLDQVIADEGTWRQAGGRLETLRTVHQGVQQNFALLTSTTGPCITCLRPMNQEERGVAAMNYDGLLVPLEEQVERETAALGVCPDVEGARQLLRRGEGAVAAVQATDQQIEVLGREIADADTALAALSTDDPEIDRLDNEYHGLVATLALVEETEAYDTLQAAVETQAALVADTERALAALPAEDPEIAVLEARLTKGEAALVEARARRDARQRAEQAEIAAGQLAAEADALGVLRDQLGPKGARERLLLERLDALTARVNEVLGAFGLALTFQGDPWAVLLNGQTPSILMGETELMRAGLAFQIALAEVTGARLVIADRIGNFDHANRAALFSVLDLGLSRGWIEQCFLFSTFISATPPMLAPAGNIALFHVVRTDKAGTTITRVA
jgi:hypothetical protein